MYNYTNLLNRFVCLLFLIIFSVNAVFAEGSRELLANAFNEDRYTALVIKSTLYGDFCTQGSSDNQRLYIHIDPNNLEGVYFGFSSLSHNKNITKFTLYAPDGTFLKEFNTGGWEGNVSGTSDENRRDKILVGPEALFAGGYDGDSYFPDPSRPKGDYYIEFNGTSDSWQGAVHIHYWDITVATASGDEKKGRVWSKQWALGQQNSSEYRPFVGALYAFSKNHPNTDKGFVTKIDFKDAGFRPEYFNISFNEKGPSMSGQEDWQSVVNDNITTPYYPIFINEPDPAIWPSDEFGDFDYSFTPQLARCGENDFRLQVQTTQPGYVQVLLDIDGIDGYTPGTTDRFIMYNIDPSTTHYNGTSYEVEIPWDGKDGQGNIVDKTVSIDVEIAYSDGNCHFPIYDAEYLTAGMEISNVRPIPTTGFVMKTYWDDSQLTSGVYQTPGGSGYKVEMNGAEQSVSRHTWENYFDVEIDIGYGNRNTLNTFWYANKIVHSKTKLEIPRYIITATSDQTICLNGSSSYSLLLETDAQNISGTETPEISWTGGNGEFFVTSPSKTYYTAHSSETVNNTEVVLTVNITGCPDYDDIKITFKDTPDKATIPIGNTVGLTDDGIITIPNSKTDYTYQVFDKNNVSVTLPFAGNNGDLDIPIDKSDLVLGDNSFEIKANNGGCVDVFDKKAVITTMVTGGNTPPTISTIANKQITNGKELIDPTSTLVDTEQNWNGGTLSIQITGGNTINDHLTVSDYGTIKKIGTTIYYDVSVTATMSSATVSNGEKLTITFVNTVSNEVVEDILNAVLYYNDGAVITTDERTVRFIAIDGLGNMNPATSISTTKLTNNAPPSANNDSFTTNEDVSISVDVLLNDVDVNGNLNSASLALLTKQANGGTLTLNSGTGKFDFVPNANFHGIYTFSYNVCDMLSVCATAKATITITPQNDPPTAANKTFTISSNSPIKITTADFNYQDLDSDPLAHIELSSTISKGTLFVDGNGNGTIENSEIVLIGNTVSATDIANEKLFYKAGPSASGTPYSNIKFRVNDGTAYSALTYTFTINANNTPPVALNDFASISKNNQATMSILSNDTDAENNIDISSLRILSKSAIGGNVSVNTTSGIATYTPSFNFKGVYTFSYEICDLNSECATAEATVNVTSSNTPPSISSETVTVAEDQTLTGDYSSFASDDSDTPIFTAATDINTNEGTFTINSSGLYTFNPAPNYNGTTNFAIKVCDTEGACAFGTIKIKVTGVDDPPVVKDDAATTTEDNSVQIDITDNDSDPDGDLDVTSVEIIKVPSSGTVQINATTGHLLYTPNANFNGKDLITYKICDSKNNCDEADVNITIIAQNDPPVANPDIITIAEDVTKISNVLANDTDPDNDIDPSTVEIITAPTHATATVDPVTGFITYIPNANYNGTDYYQYKVCDSHNACVSTNVTITITPINDQPTATGGNFTINENVSHQFNVKTNTSDPDNNIDYTSISLVSQPQNGTASIDYLTGKITYTPDEYFNGTDSYTYQICDNGAPSLCNQATVNYTIDAVDNPPLAYDDLVTTAQNNSKDIFVAANDKDPDNDLDITSIEIIGNATKGSTVVHASTGKIVYTPNSGASGTDSFEYKIYDAKRNFATATVTINISNEAPIANNDDVYLDEDGKKIFNPISNDFDPQPNLDISTFKIIDGPSHGNLLIDKNTGNATYTPVEDFYGKDSFNYEICDEDGYCSRAVVNITIASKNDPPIARNDSETTNEDTKINIQIKANDEDPDGNINNATIYISDSPANGTAFYKTATGVIEYIPNPNFNGIELFSYRLCDEDGLCDYADVSVTVISVNDPPVALDDDNFTFEDVSITLSPLANDYDNDGNINVASLEVISTPTNGKAVVTANGNIIYTPNPNYNGTDSYTYKICDTDGDCTNAKQTITIISMPDPPVAKNDGGTITEDSFWAANLLDNDIDVESGLNPASISLILSPKNGTVQINKTNGDVVYTPNNDFNGSEKFTYSVCNFSGLCASAEVNVNITAVADPPVATDDHQTVNEGGSIIIDILSNDSDPDGDLDPSTLKIQSSSNNGTIILLPDNTVSYVAKSGFSGTDIYSYEICDSEGSCDKANITFTISNHAPKTQDDYAETNEDTAIDIDVLANDNDPQNNINPASVRIAKNPEKGTVIINPQTGVMSYLPNSNFNGDDYFEYWVCDLTSFCSLGRVYVKVHPVGEAPQAYNDNIVTPEDVWIDIDVLANDVDVDGDLNSSSLSIIAAPLHGNISIKDGIITYSPHIDYYGKDLFTYAVCDFADNCTSATVNIRVDFQYDIPVAKDDLYHIDENETLHSFPLMNDIDVDGNIDTSSLSILISPDHGNATVNKVTGEITYTPNKGYSGVDEMIYRICDTENQCVIAEINIIINAVNDAPTANDDYYDTTEDTPIYVGYNAIIANDIEPDGDHLSLEVISETQNGTVQYNALTQTLIYIPKANFFGSDSFDYKICDQAGECGTATVNLNITSVNDKPIAVRDNVIIAEETPTLIYVTQNDSDPDNDLILNSVKIVFAPTFGTAKIDENGYILYTPEKGFNGIDELTYEVCDATGLCSEAIVKMSVKEVSDPPIAVDDNVTTKEDESIAIDVAKNDIDEENSLNPKSVRIEKASLYGTLEVNADNGNITYHPNANFNGSDYFQYEICDNSGLCDFGDVTVTVAPIADAPIANNDFHTTGQDSPININVLHNDDDPDGDLNYQSLIIVDNPANGSVSTNPKEGTVLYTPNAGYTGTDIITYAVCDESSPSPKCSEARVFVVVKAIPHPPVAIDNTATTNENQAVTINVLLNDYDQEDNIDRSTLSIIQQPSNGTVNIDHQNGTIIYTPNSGFAGIELFKYGICDTDDLCAAAEVRVTVRQLDNTQFKNIELLFTNINQSVTADISAYTGSSTPTLQLINPPRFGSVSTNNGVPVYTPQQDYEGSDIFNLKICSDNCTTITYIVHIANKKPIASNDAAETIEDNTVTIDILNNDLKGDAVLLLSEVKLYREAKHGAVAFHPTTGAATYTPFNNYNGSDSFSYQLCDANNFCDIATVDIIVSPVDYAPVATNDITIINEDGSLNLNVWANDYDLDNDLDPLSVSVEVAAAVGSARAQAGNIVYNPPANFFGKDSLVYTICDAKSNCSTAWVIITVQAENDPLYATDDYYTTLQNTATIDNILDNDQDPDNDIKSITHTEPKHGNVSIDTNTGDATYTPDDGFSGNDTYEYSISDGNNIDKATVFIEVKRVNAPPFVVDDAAKTNEDTTVPVYVIINDKDTDGGLDLKSLEIIAPPKNGIIKAGLTGGIFDYTPFPDFNGMDVFEYKICDTDGACQSASVTISVLPVEDAPLALDDYYTIDENNSIAMPVWKNDSDPEGKLLPSSIELLSVAENGLLSFNVNTTNIEYTPNKGFFGEERLMYRIWDEAGKHAEAVITIKIGRQHIPPVATDDYINTPEDSMVKIPILDNDYDANNNIDPASLIVLIKAENGNVVLDKSTGIASYTPIENFNGVDKFTYKICDSDQACDLAQVYITVLPLDDPPRPIDDYYTVAEDGTIKMYLLNNDSDPDNNLDPTSIFVVENQMPLSGILSIDIEEAYVEYIPNPDYMGNDVFTYNVCDETNLCESAVVYITVSPGNDAPIAINDYATITQGKILTSDVAQNDIDADNNLLPSSIHILNPPISGANAYHDGFGSIVIDYSKESDFSGTDSLVYRIYDEQEQYADAILYIEVLPYKTSVRVPQAFSPNGDGVNDYFTIPDIKEFPNNKLQIFNRWGTLVYEKDQYPNDWEGKYKENSEPLPAGTYFYILHLVDGQKALTGFIELQR